MLSRPSTIASLRRLSVSAISRKHGPPSATAGVPKAETKQLDGNVPGCVGERKEPSGPVGPGASKTGEYKAPEYFCYSKWFFTEAEVEMRKYRCPQPTANKK